MNDSCRSLFQLQNAKEFDAEAGIKQVSKTKGNLFNLKCSKFVFKVIFGIMVISVAIGYFMAISRNSNLIGHSDEFDTAYVINSPKIGKFHTFYTYLFRFTNKLNLSELLDGEQSSQTTNIKEQICNQCKYLISIPLFEFQHKVQNCWQT